MEISFANLKEKEVINIFDGKKLGHIVDIVFDNQSVKVLGVVVPGIRKFLHKTDDIFIAIENLKKIGEDVLLVKLVPQGQYAQTSASAVVAQSAQSSLEPYIKYRRKIKKEK